MSKSLNLSYGKAIYEGIYQSMLNNPNVFIFGQGVDDYKGHYGTTLNLHKKFGKERVFDTPISEDSLTGIAIGSSLAGMRPIFVHQRMDFLMLCMNQLVNMASKICYLSNGIQNVPIVIRASIGRSWGQGAQHSQSLYSFFAHVPGLKVIAPTTPHDVKGGIIASINDNNPVIFVEHRMLYENKGLVPKKKYEISLSSARVTKKGSDLTLIGVSYTVVDCLRASEILKDKKIDVEVIDLICISNLDIKTIIKSAKKTKKIIIVDNDWLYCGLASEIATQITERLKFKIPIERMGYKFSPCPTTRNLEDNFYPSANLIAKKAYEMITNKKDWTPKKIIHKEILEFKGPF
ncbi:alpha-ketoacid dehydrogenase subunit beta [Alphaproteobacteria bacterium]|nr:alpha-ketoacid dehydrogenase subunit beta [Alphaproteobacteria bacterium]